MINNAHVALEAKIDAHSKILERVQDHAAAPQQLEIKSLELDVQKNAEQLQTTAPKEANPEQNFAPKEADVVNLMQQTKQTLDTEKQNPEPQLGEDILTDSGQALQVAQRAIIYAEINKTEGNKDQAYSSLLDSQRASEEAATSLGQLKRLGKQ